MKADTVVLFDTYGSSDSRLHSVFLYHLEVGQNSIPCQLWHAYHVFLLPAQSEGKKQWRPVWISVCHRLCNVTLLWQFLSAIESVLLSVLSALEAEMVFIRNLVGGLLAELEDNIDHDKFKRLLHYSRRLTSFKNRAKLVRHLPHLCPSYVELSYMDRWKKL